MLIGVNSPEEFVFDEVHYVPAARQMLELATSTPMLNPMHPPLAKQMIALSIRSFGDNPLGWRYPGTLFGSPRDRRDLFRRTGPVRSAGAGDRRGPDRVFQPDAVRAIADRDAGYFRAGLRPVRRRGLHPRVPEVAAASCVRSRGRAFGLSVACKWSGLFGFATCIVIVAAIRLMRGWRTQFADGKADDWYRPELWPDFRWLISPSASSCFAALVYLATFVRSTGFRRAGGDILEAQRRILADNTTSAIAGHTYMSAWQSWPFLVRPVWYLFDKVTEDRIAAVVFLGNPLILWPALLALAVTLRDWIVARRADAFLVLTFYFGPYLAWALLPRTLGFIYYYLPAATTASFALVYALDAARPCRAG